MKTRQFSALRRLTLTDIAQRYRWLCWAFARARRAGVVGRAAALEVAAHRALRLYEARVFGTHRAVAVIRSINSVNASQERIAS